LEEISAGRETTPHFCGPCDHDWLTEEALSAYVRNAGLFGNDMHSPIMCIAGSIPAVVCRFTE